MFLAEKTVKNYVSALLRKLDIERRTEAAVYAVERAKKQRPQTSAAHRARRWRC